MTLFISFILVSFQNTSTPFNKINYTPYLLNPERNLMITKNPISLMYFLSLSAVTYLLYFSKTPTKKLRDLLDNGNVLLLVDLVLIKFNSIDNSNHDVLVWK